MIAATDSVTPDAGLTGHLLATFGEHGDLIAGSTRCSLVCAADVVYVLVEICFVYGGASVSFLNCRVRYAGAD